MLKEILTIPNGDSYSKVSIYECDRCKCVFDESQPHTKDHCWDCSFIEGLISEEEYISCIGIALPNTHASVKDGKVVVWVGKKSPWDKTPKELRNTPRYRSWRKSVFERDNYTCQHCGQRGGELNAHHIKTYAKHESLRYELNNGLTLCVDCHRVVHKKSG